MVNILGTSRIFGSPCHALPGNVRPAPLCGFIPEAGCDILAVACFEVGIATVINRARTLCFAPAGGTGLPSGAGRARASLRGVLHEAVIDPKARSLRGSTRRGRAFERLAVRAQDQAVFRLDERRCG